MFRNFLKRLKHNIHGHFSPGLDRVNGSTSIPNNPPPTSLFDKQWIYYHSVDLKKYWCGLGTISLWRHRYFTIFDLDCRIHSHIMMQWMTRWWNFLRLLKGSTLLICTLSHSWSFMFIKCCKGPVAFIF